MSDTDDAIAKAVAAHKQLAASRLVRGEELEAELVTLRRQRAELDETAAAAGDDEALRAEVEGLGRELDAKIAAAAGELAVCRGEQQAALAEVGELRKLAGKSAVAGARALVASVGDSDPVLRSAEENALDAARAHIRELGAQARLGEELSGGRETPRPAAPSRADADDEARRQFDALRARREVPGGGGEAGGTAEAPSDLEAAAAKPGTPKKTL